MTSLLTFALIIFGLLLAILAIVLITMVIFLGGDVEPSDNHAGSEVEYRRGIPFLQESLSWLWPAHPWGGCLLAG